MKTYIYTVENSSIVRGKNRTINVYRMKNNKPIWLGSNDRINTASTVGDKGEAVKLIGKLCGHKHDSYNLLADNIQVLAV